MKRVSLFLMLLLIFCASLVAQTPVAPAPAPAAIRPLDPDFIGLGAGYAGNLSKHVVPWVAYGHEFTNDFYSYSRVDVLGMKRHPLRAETVMTTGICQITKHFRVAFLGACLDGGVAADGQNVGGAIGADGLGGIRIGKHFGFVGTYGVLRTALDSTQYVLRAGFVYGFHE